MIRFTVFLENKEKTGIELAEEIRSGLAKERDDLGLHLSFDQAGNINGIKIATEGTFKRFREKS